MPIIFGYDAWDRRTLASHCVWSGPSGAYHGAAYTAKVRVSVRAGDITIVREGSGTGEARAPTPGQAHKLALKGAETDATKRALATFGNPFGLALYDREHAGVRKTRGASASPIETSRIGPCVLRSSIGKPVSSHNTAKSFVEALKQGMSEAHDIELLYEVWEQNIETLRVLHRSTHERLGIVPTMVSHLRACAVDLVKRASNGSAHPLAKGNGGTQHKIDKSVLTISEPKRIRCKEHLRLVAEQPCLVCGRSPSHAHHIRYAQAKGLGLKVSDEFTVPLCAIHHSENHATGNERRWWQEHNLDPSPWPFAYGRRAVQPTALQVRPPRLNLMRKSLSPVSAETISKNNAASFLHDSKHRSSSGCRVVSTEFRCPHPGAS